MLQLDESENDCEENGSHPLDMNDDGDIDCISNINDLLSSDDNILNEFSHTQESMSEQYSSYFPRFIEM